MTIPRSRPAQLAVAVSAAALSLGLTACGAHDSVAKPGGTTPTASFAKVDAPLAPPTPHDFAHEPRCFPGRHCAR